MSVFHRPRTQPEKTAHLAFHGCHCVETSGRHAMFVHAGSSMTFRLHSNRHLCIDSHEFMSSSKYMHSSSIASGAQVLRSCLIWIWNPIQTSAFLADVTLSYVCMSAPTSAVCFIWDVQIIARCDQHLTTTATGELRRQPIEAWRCSFARSPLKKVTTLGNVVFGDTNSGTYQMAAPTLVQPIPPLQ